MVMGSGRLGWGVSRQCLGWSLGRKLCPRCVFPFVCLEHSLCFWLVNLGLFGSFCGISGDVVEA